MPLVLLLVIVLVNVRARKVDDLNANFLVVSLTKF